MKSLLKAVSLICTIILYGLLVSQYNKGAFSTNDALVGSGTDNEETYFSSVSSNLFYHTNQNESLVNGFNNILHQFSLKKYLVHDKNCN
jgi:hypothetical protein